MSGAHRELAQKFDTKTFSRKVTRFDLVHPEFTFDHPEFDLESKQEALPAGASENQKQAKLNRKKARLKPIKEIQKCVLPILSLYILPHHFGNQ